jgi:hypothetical protein
MQLSAAAAAIAVGVRWSAAVGYVSAYRATLVSELAAVIAHRQRLRWTAQAALPATESTVVARMCRLVFARSVQAHFSPRRRYNVCDFNVVTSTAWHS